MTARPPRAREETTPITVRRSSTDIGLGPVYAALARELSLELYERRLASLYQASALGDLARECDHMAEVFADWSRTIPPPSPAKVNEDVAAWQSIKARARALGSKVQ